LASLQRAALGGFDIGAGGAVELGSDPLAAFGVNKFDLVGIARGLGFAHLGGKFCTSFIQGHGPNAWALPSRARTAQVIKRGFFIAFKIVDLVVIVDRVEIEGS
jgi:hypothetical protein